MRFACIQDCSICPFSCGRDLSFMIFQNIEKDSKNAKLPQILQKKSIFNEIIVKNNEIQSISDDKSQILTETDELKIDKTEDSSKEENGANLNLPAIQELQYTVESIPQKKKFSILRRKKNAN